MKLTTDIYLKFFHLPKCWGVPYRVWEEIHKNTSPNDPKNQLFDLVLTISLYFNKKCSKLMHHFACRHWSKSQTKLTFSGVLAKRPQKSSLKWKNIWKLKTQELQIRYCYNLLSLCATLTPSFTENWGCHSKGKTHPKKNCVSK